MSNNLLENGRKKSKHKTRRVRRLLVDSTLPKSLSLTPFFLLSSHLSSSDLEKPPIKICIRVPLDPTSEEYQKSFLLNFHLTMLGKYSQIIKIERIQKRNDGTSR